ncbi:MAG: hypothetical protein ACREP1_03205, partial [Rhodanobacteraceae bacterium]
MKKVENLDACERGAFDLEDTQRRFEIAELIEAEADGCAAGGLLRAGNFVEISDGFARFGERGFEHGAVAMRFESAHEGTAGGAARISGDQVFE